MGVTVHNCSSSPTNPLPRASRDDRRTHHATSLRGTVWSWDVIHLSSTGMQRLGRLCPARLSLAPLSRHRSPRHHLRRSIPRAAMSSTTGATVRHVASVGRLWREMARKHPQPRRPPNIFVVHRLSSSASASPVRRPFPRSSSRVVAFLPLHHPATSIVLSASRSAFPFLHHQHPPGEHLLHT